MKPPDSLRTPTQRAAISAAAALLAETVSVAGAAIDAAPRVDVARPILICGVGRSGTSLLHSMLNAHPDIAFPPETHFFRRYIAPRRQRRSLEQGTRAEAIAVWTEDRDLARVELTLEVLLEDQRDGDLDLVQAFRRILALNAERQGKHRVGDKDPRNIDYLPALAESFPRALVLHVIRDPREVLLSRTRAAWSRDRPWWQHALLADEQLRRGRRNGAALFGEGYFEVSYENLLRAPEATLRRIAQHVEVDYTHAMLDFGASAAQLVDERERSWKSETLGPLLVDNVEKWRTGLTAAQVRFVERVSVEAFTRCGYERSAPATAGTKNSSFAQRAFALAAPLCRPAARCALAARRRLEELR